MANSKELAQQARRHTMNVVAVANKLGISVSRMAQEIDDEAVEIARQRSDVYVSTALKELEEAQRALRQLGQVLHDEATAAAEERYGGAA